MRIRDWSADVCSSDLAGDAQPIRERRVDAADTRQVVTLARAQPGAACRGVDRARIGGHGDAIVPQRRILTLERIDARLGLFAIGGVRLALSLVARAPFAPAGVARKPEQPARDQEQRSEEHTSELQS